MVMPTGHQRCALGCGAIVSERGPGECQECARVADGSRATVEMRKVAKAMERDPGDGWRYDPMTCQWVHPSGTRMTDEKLARIGLAMRERLA